MKLARRSLILAGVGPTIFSGACTIKHELVPPKEPLRIELAIKIDQEVRVWLDKDVEALINENPGLF